MSINFLIKWYDTLGPLWMSPITLIGVYKDNLLGELELDSFHTFTQKWLEEYKENWERSEDRRKRKRIQENPRKKRKIGKLGFNRGVNILVN